MSVNFNNVIQDALHYQAFLRNTGAGLSITKSETCKQCIQRFPATSKQENSNKPIRNRLVPDKVFICDNDVKIQ